MPFKDKWTFNFNTLKIPLLFVFVFYSIAFWRYFATGKTFYIFNFIYIGTSIAAGILLNNALPKKYVLWGRRITQILIGLYMLGYVGFGLSENMQIEGFFFYLFAGVFAGATLHYFIAKIIGPVFFNRGWCGWACWTAMVLDILPWKKPAARIKKLGILRYIHFFISLGLVLYFWFIVEARNITDHSKVEIYWLSVGNIIYYISAIVLAGLFKDNRAFCKYLCPIPTFQKILSRFALLKVSIDPQKCNICGLCEKNCPMGIKLLQYKDENKRVLSTECILCTTCANVCPQKAINMTFKFDFGKEYLRIKN
jgi:ferredoxin-type protein NapH